LVNVEVNWIEFVWVGKRLCELVRILTGLDKVDYNIISTSLIYFKVA